MAHKGKLWPVQQHARYFSGQKTWPNYPAKAYTYRSDGWQGTAAHPSQYQAILCEFVGNVAPNRCRWQSQDLGPSPQVTVIALDIVIPDPPSDQVITYEHLWVDGVDQFDQTYPLVSLEWWEHAGYTANYGRAITGWTLWMTGAAGWDAVPY